MRKPVKHEPCIIAIGLIIMTATTALAAPLDEISAENVAMVVANKDSYPLKYFSSFCNNQDCYAVDVSAKSECDLQPRLSEQRANDNAASYASRQCSLWLEEKTDYSPSFYCQTIFDSSDGSGYLAVARANDKSVMIDESYSTGVSSSRGNSVSRQSTENEKNTKQNRKSESVNASHKVSIPKITQFGVSGTYASDRTDTRTHGTSSTHTQGQSQSDASDNNRTMRISGSSDTFVWYSADKKSEAEAATIRKCNDQGVTNCNLEIVFYGRRYGQEAEITCPTADPVKRAIRAGNIEHFKIFTESGMPIYDTALHDAVMDGKLSLVKSVVSAQKDLFMDDQGQTALWHVPYDRPEIMEYLVKAFGASALNMERDVSVTPGTRSYPRTLLVKAIFSGNTSWVELLIRLGADPIGRSWSSPLIAAIATQNLEIFEMLISKIMSSGESSNPTAGIIANFADMNGDTLLHVAAGVGQVRIGQLLLGFGANIRQTNHQGRTPLHLAAAGKHIGFVRLLLEHDEHLRDPEHISIADLLDEDGLKAIHMPFFLGYPPDVELGWGGLTDEIDSAGYGKDFGLWGKSGNTTLHDVITLLMGYTNTEMKLNEEHMEMIFGEVVKYNRFVADEILDTLVLLGLLDDESGRMRAFINRNWYGWEKNYDIDAQRLEDLPDYCVKAVPHLCAASIGVLGLLKNWYRNGEMSNVELDYEFVNEINLIQQTHWDGDDWPMVDNKSRYSFLVHHDLARDSESGAWSYLFEVYSWPYEHRGMYRGDMVFRLDNQEDCEHGDMGPHLHDHKGAVRSLQLGGVEQAWKTVIQMVRKNEGMKNDKRPFRMLEKGTTPNFRLEDT